MSTKPPLFVTYVKVTVPTPLGDDVRFFKTYAEAERFRQSLQVSQRWGTKLLIVG